ncbi:MAG: hypothetical protein ISR58_05295 [Anaerolineales bacterium]|nr:hypothetical protein [Chloroflexota bacterium]MBL6980589.1 hypothetical protein [Anaerolineales bacterium]
MDERENTQPEEIPEERESTDIVEAAEPTESAESAEERTLEETTHEPGARVEQTQNYEEAEAVEGALTEAMNPAEEVAGIAPVPLPKPADGIEGELPSPSTDPKDLPQGSGTLDVDESYPDDPQEAAGTPEVWDDRAEEGGATYGAKPGVPEGDSGWLGTSDNDGILAESTPAEVIEVPEGVEINPKDEDDGSVGRDDHPVNEGRDGLEYEPGPVEQPPDWDHGPPGPKVELENPGPAGAAEIPQGIEFKPAGEDDGSVGRGDHPIEEDPELSTTPGESKEDEYYVDARGVIRSEAGDQGGQLGLDHPGTGGLEASEEDVGVDGRFAQEPDPMPEPGLSPEFDGNVGEEPEPGPDPYQPIMEEGMLVTEEGEMIVAGVEPGLTAEAMAVEGSLEQDQEADQEVTEEEADEGAGEAPGWYIKEDSEGNYTVVDENGNPVESPPKIVYFNGKYYAVYPGDDLPVKEDGSVTDPEKLAKYEISSYKPSTEGMKVYYDEDGNPKVVDENGETVDSPPGVIQDPTTGKYYFITETDPSKLASFTKSGNFAEALSQGLISEAAEYKPSTEGMKVYYDEDGNPKVVDEKGKPVDSPPGVIQDPTTGKYYFITETDPSKLASFTKSGNFAEALSQGLITEAPDYKPTTEGMKIYYNEDGNPRVVDENGKTVDSPPGMIQDPTTGKYYFITETDPTKLASFTKSGNFAEALSQGLISEAPEYKPSTEGMKIYYDKDGNPTVVDENGKPVDSPPGVIQDPISGKYFFITEADPAKMSAFTKSGNFDEALYHGWIKEAPNYKPSTKGLHIYPDNDGNPTVVDENGKPVDSPPGVIQDPSTGKYYFITETDPSKLASFTKSGNFAEALSQGLITDASYYKPPWWSKKAS